MENFALEDQEDLELKLRALVMTPRDPNRDGDVHSQEEDEGSQSNPEGGENQKRRQGGGKKSSEHLTFPEYLRGVRYEENPFQPSAPLEFRREDGKQNHSRNVDPTQNGGLYKTDSEPNLHAYRGDGIGGKRFTQPFAKGHSSDPYFMTTGLGRGVPMKNSEPKTIDHEALRPVRIPITPQKFGGEKGSDSRSHLHNYNTISVCNGWNDQLKLTFFPLYLTNFAARWYTAATSERKRLNKGDWTWKELEDAFLRNATCSAVKADDEWELLSRKQRFHESPMEYFYEMQNLADRVSAKMPDSLRVKHTLRGLEPSILKQILLHNPTTMADLQTLLEWSEVGESLESKYTQQEEVIFMTETPNVDPSIEKKVRFSPISASQSSSVNRWNPETARQNKAWSFKGNPLPPSSRSSSFGPDRDRRGFTLEHRRDWHDRGQPYPHRRFVNLQRRQDFPNRENDEIRSMGRRNPQKYPGDRNETQSQSKYQAPIDRTRYENRERVQSPWPRRPSFVPREQILAEGLCFGCHSKNHFIKDCPENKESKNSFRRASQNPQ